MDGSSRDPNVSRDKTPCGAGGVHGWGSMASLLGAVIFLTGAVWPRLPAAADGQEPRDQCLPWAAENLLYRDRRAHSSSTSSRAISYRPRQKGHGMSILGWIVLGLIAGFIA